MNFHKLDLNLLVALDALLEERHVGHAAERLHVSQPTMSVALSKLREHYGDEILIRDGRSMAVTAFAASLKPMLRQFMAETRSLASAGAGFDAAKSDRRFVVVMSEGYSRLYVPGLVRRMREAAPSTILTCLGLATSTIRLFNEGEADLLLIPSGAWLTEDDRSWMERQPSELASEDHRVCLAWAGNAEIGDPTTLAEIQRRRVVIPSFVSNDSRAPKERPLSRFYGADLTVAAEVPVTAIGATLVGTDLICLIDRRHAEFEARRFDLKLARLPPELDQLHSHRLCWNRRSAGDPAITWLKTLLREEIALFAPAPGAVKPAPRRKDGRTAAVRTHHPGAPGTAGSG